MSNTEPSAPSLSGSGLTKPDLSGVDLTGLSAFVLTPLHSDSIDTDSLTALVRRAAARGVDSLGILGSTGSYAYFDRDERREVLRTAVAAAGDTPVIVGIGAHRTRHIVQYAHDAQESGAAALLLPVMTYQSLSDDEALSIFRAVADEVPLPIVVYDNPGTTHFTFSEELYLRIAEVPTVVSIKIPPTRLPAAPGAARQYISDLHDRLPTRVTLGISGDAVGANGLLSGCATWYSTLAGTVVKPLVRIARLAQAQDPQALELNAKLDPIWDMNAKHGSMRVAATLAELMGLTSPNSTPAPVTTVQGADRDTLAELADTLRLGE